MPYRLKEDALANRRLKYRVSILRGYEEDHVAAFDESAGRSDIYCIDCKKISAYSTPKQNRHYTDCEHYTGEL